LASSRSIECRGFCRVTKQPLHPAFAGWAARWSTRPRGGHPHLDLFLISVARHRRFSPTSIRSSKPRMEREFPCRTFIFAAKPVPLPPMSLPTAVSTDVFISIASRSQTRRGFAKDLIARARAEGLRVCIDYRDFGLGAPFGEEMARGVEQSRYTLTILSSCVPDQ